MQNVWKLLKIKYIIFWAKSENQSSEMSNFGTNKTEFASYRELKI
jgi:hypothetical protein